MTLRVQAVKYSLFGVSPLKSNLFKYPSKGEYSTIHQYAGAHAVAIFNHLKTGTVGFSDYLQGEREIMKQFVFVINCNKLPFCLINL